MMGRFLWTCVVACVVVAGYPVQAVELSAKEALGKRLFFDPNLSHPAGQSCASCHAPQTGFADPRQQLPVSEGVHPGRFTSRNSPPVSYASYTPALHLDTEEKIYVGGLFLDGRADTLEQQAEGPLLSPVEMANADKADIVQRLRTLGYLKDFQTVYGEPALSDTETGYAQLTDLLATYQRSTEVNPFSSKFDYYLAGKVQLTAQEHRGWQLYDDEDKGNCAACHPSAMNDDTPPLFTDFTYDNLGTPANPDNPFYNQDARFNPAGSTFVDRGLGETVNDPAQDGKFRVPTLRNIELTAPYMHNGVFKTLKEVVEFYNTRDVSDRWGKPEVAENVNSEELGDLKLTEQEVDDIVAFMKTLTDGYRLPEAAQQ